MLILGRWGSFGGVGRRWGWEVFDYFWMLASTYKIYDLKQVGITMGDLVHLPR